MGIQPEKRSIMDKRAAKSSCEKVRRESLHRGPVYLLPSGLPFDEAALPLVAWPDRRDGILCGFRDYRQAHPARRQPDHSQGLPAGPRKPGGRRDVERASFSPARLDARRVLHLDYDKRLA